MLSYPSSIALSAWRYVREAVDLLAVAGDDLAAAVARIRRLAYAILDGTLIPIDRVADQKPYYSGKHKRHGVNVQVIADPAGRLVWASPALPGAVHDLTAARTVGLIDALTTADVLTFADRGYQGAGGGVRTPFRRHRRRQRLSRREKAVNRSHARIHALGERAIATLKTWRLLNKPRCCPRRATAIVQAILALHHVENPPLRQLKTLREERTCGLSNANTRPPAASAAEKYSSMFGFAGRSR